MKISQEMFTYGLAIGALNNSDLNSALGHFSEFILLIDEKIKTAPKDTEINQSKTEAISEFSEKLLETAEKFQTEKEYEKAIIAYKNYLKYTPEQKYENAEFWSNLGYCCSEFKAFDLAISCYEHCYKLNNKNEDMLRLIADIYYFQKKDFDKAIEYYEKYIQFNQNNALVYNMLGHIYSTKFKSEHIDKQIEYFKKAHRLNPKEIQFLRNLTLVLGKEKKLDEVLKYYEKMFEIGCNNDDLYDLACIGFRCGRFDIAHKYLDRRFLKEKNATKYEDLEIKKWDRISDLTNKTILVCCEQGFGDSIMYVRFLPQMQKIAKKVILKVQKELIPLFRHNFENIEIVSNEEKNQNINYDCQIPLLDLFTAFCPTPEDLPLKEGYLSAQEEKIDLFKQHIDSRQFKIGIAFKGHPAFTGQNREFPTELLNKFTQIQKAQIYSFQVGSSDKTLQKLTDDNLIIDLTPHFSDFSDTAGAMQHMDLIISIDNCILNLAGALGVKTIGLFNYYTDNRWFALEKGDSGWYKSVTPYIAKKHDDWEELISKVCEDVQNFIYISKKTI